MWIKWTKPRRSFAGSSLVWGEDEEEREKAKWQERNKGNDERKKEEMIGKRKEWRKNEEWTDDRIKRKQRFKI